jgi:hypothetical protein
MFSFDVWECFKKPECLPERQMKTSHSIKTSKVFGVDCRRTNFLGRDQVPYFNGGESLVDSRPTLCYKAATYQVSNMGGIQKTTSLV